MAKKDNWPLKALSYKWKSNIDYRLHPEEYCVGKGEQGVLLCEPYKSEILPYWHFKTPEIARESSTKIFALFEQYLQQEDFVGADMARKYLQMGFTRARRYANHKGGRKYDPKSGEELPRIPEDPIKAESARIFYAKWKEAEAHPFYKQRKSDWKLKYG